MVRSGIQVDIPAFGALDIRTVCSDFTGTLSVGVNSWSAWRPVSASWRNWSTST